MGAPPGYQPSAWVHLLHQLPRADFQLRPVPSGFAPQEQQYQQALMLVAALAGLGLGLSLIFIAVYLIRFCCCRPPEPPGAKSPPPGGGCVTWSCIAALLVGCVGIGIGFYGNSETSDGVSQLSSALLHANHTLSTIDHLVLETVEGLGRAVRTELTTLEEVLAQRTELVAAARGARRQAEAVAQQLQGLAFWQGVPLNPLQVAEEVSFVEEYRWLAYVLLLLLELLICLFTLLGLAKQSKWLVVVMTAMSLLVLVLSWGSMGLEAATAVGVSDFCSNPDTYVLNLTQEETGLSSGNCLLPHFPQASGDLVPLGGWGGCFAPTLACWKRGQGKNAGVRGGGSRGHRRRRLSWPPALARAQVQGDPKSWARRGPGPCLPTSPREVLGPVITHPPSTQDYGMALRGLCEDALEGLLFLLLFSLLSAGALATALCSLPRAWALFAPSDDYDDTEDDDPFNPQESKRFVQWQSSI
nr:protein tweety homolog 1 [Cavia porcellus]